MDNQSQKTFGVLVEVFRGEAGMMKLFVDPRKHAGWTELNAEYVKVECEAWLEALDYSISVQRQKMVNELMNKRFFPAKTEEAAIKELQKPLNAYTTLSRWSLVGSSDEDRREMVTKLLRLAEISCTKGSGKIVVGSDASFIFNEYNQDAE